jgi:hypothetical protein
MTLQKKNNRGYKKPKRALQQCFIGTSIVTNKGLVILERVEIKTEKDTKTSVIKINMNRRIGEINKRAHCWLV